MVTTGGDWIQGLQLLILNTLPFLRRLAVLQVNTNKSEHVWEAL